MKRITPLILFVLAVALVVLLAQDVMADTGSVHGYISGRVTTTRNVSLADISVILVNASNTSQDVPGFNASCDQFGYFQFLDVPAGNYKAFAWGPYLSAGISNNVTVEDNVTYMCAVVLVPEPYYGNITSSRRSISPGETAELTITVYDFWETPVGPGKMVSLSIVGGSPVNLNPPYGLTDGHSQFKTTLTAPDNGSFTELQEFARGWNGTYYPLQKRIEAAAATPTPTASPSPAPTAAPNATATPTTAPNATATPT
ncbi:MAG TPA: carboxypeptidase-like regulatory domain-containing protein, partial [Methanocella sp.]|nr:carboxypeptidase-like regulatory domain-containing protein [Methanocella sp.]